MESRKIPWFQTTNQLLMDYHPPLLGQFHSSFDPGTSKIVAQTRLDRTVKLHLEILAKLYSSICMYI